MRVEQLQVMPAGITTNITDHKVSNEKGFGEYLTDALGKVNQLQQDSQQTSLDLATGKIQDISQVVIATEKATMALQLTMQVRNKIIDSYQEIMRMQV